MTEAEFRLVRKIAGDILFDQLDTKIKEEAYIALDGFGFRGKRKIKCTPLQAAIVLNWQCLGLNGLYVESALTEIKEAYMNNVVLIK